MSGQGQKAGDWAVLEELPAEFCLRHSARLVSHHCKMLYPRCGHFTSCAEFEQASRAPKRAERIYFLMVPE